MRVTSRPLTVAATIKPIISGKVDSPLVVACTPCPSCMNKGRNATTLRNDIDEKKPAVLAQVNTLLPNSSMWMIGSCTLFSTITNSTAQIKNMANRPTTIGESHGIFLAAEGQRQQQRHAGRDDQHRTEIIDASLGGMRQLRHLGDDHEQRDQANRQIEVKHPSPTFDGMTRQGHRSMVGEVAAQQRADGAREAEDAAEQVPQICRALAAETDRR